MSTLRLSLLARSLVGWQIACALIGLPASLIPMLPKTHPFWGCNRSWSSMSPRSVGIHQVEPGSPASAAGSRNDDIVTACQKEPP